MKVAKSSTSSNYKINVFGFIVIYLIGYTFPYMRRMFNVTPQIRFLSKTTLPFYDEQINLQMVYLVKIS